ncbi:MAG: FxsA family protein [Rhodobacteraceae bacterium]|nr:FxsA family protein [Paracoccaceae bacterium]
MYLFIAFLMVPIIEIALFIQIGGAIGLWPTLAIVVLTAVLGTWLVRTQGRLALGQLQNSFSTLNDPTEPLAHGAMILVAGALLLTPGFFTDAVGCALLMPPVRMAFFHYLRNKVKVAQFRMGTRPGSGQGPNTVHPTYSRDDIIDADFEEVKADNEPSKPSGWVDRPKRH